MKPVSHHDVAVITALIGLLAVAVLLVHIPARPQMWVYPLLREATVAKTNFETRHMDQYETEHFIIKYTPADAKAIDMIGQAAEAAYRPVTDELGFAPKQKTLVIVYPTKADLRKAFGWSSNESAMGVYWGGVIQLLSPSAWLANSDSVAEFIQKGPMVHEFTHLVFDNRTNGNYPRWFTEGLAQYVEYRVNDYEWVAPTNRLDQQLYTMQQLDNDFDNLGNQSLAYRQSLAAVRYIAAQYGEQALTQVVRNLEQGRSMENAIRQATGLEYTAYDAAWRAWAATAMKNYEPSK